MKLDIAEIIVPSVIGAAVGAVFGGRRGAMVGLGLGGGVGTTLAVVRAKNDNATMGRSQQALQGTARVLAAAGLDPIDSAPGGV